MSGDVEAWRKWFAENVQPELDKMPPLTAPCPNCKAGGPAEYDTTCGYCFICHGRNRCGCDGPEHCYECETVHMPNAPCPEGSAR